MTPLERCVVRAACRFFLALIGTVLGVALATLFIYGVASVFGFHVGVLGW